MPVATIILNSYNQATYLPESIESALGQTVEDLELLIVDNGSSDGSHDIIRRYADADQRVRVRLHDKNAAVTKRFNEAIDAASSPFVSFLYSDDMLLPDKLERQVDQFTKLPGDYGVVYAPAIGWNTRTGRRWTHGSIGASGWILGDLMPARFDAQIDMVSPLTRTACLRHHRFYEDVFAEGEGIFFRIALTHRFAFDPQPVCVLRDHGANAGKAVRRNAEMTMVMLERLALHPELPTGAAADVVRFRAARLRSYAWQAVRVGEDPVWARNCLREAMTLDPRSAASPRALATLGLSAVPAAARRRVNRLGTILRRSPGNDVLVHGFGD